MTNETKASPVHPELIPPNMTDGPQCDSQSANPDSAYPDGWRCTAGMNHGGRFHAAYGGHRELIAVWPLDDPTRPINPTTGEDKP